MRVYYYSVSLLLQPCLYWGPFPLLQHQYWNLHYLAKLHQNMAFLKLVCFIIISNVETLNHTKNLVHSPYYSNLLNIRSQISVIPICGNTVGAIVCHCLTHLKGISRHINIVSLVITIGWTKA